MTSQADLRRFATQRAFEARLRKNYASSNRVWLLIAKPGADKSTATYPEAAEVALCYWWIDGQKKSIDAHHCCSDSCPGACACVVEGRQFKAEALIQSGAMQPSGMSAVERVRSDGRWDAAYEGPRSAVVPSDLQPALGAEPDAGDFSAGLDRASGYAVLRRVQTAVRPETRSRRIKTLVATLAHGEKVHG